MGEIYNDLPDWMRERILLVSKEQDAYTKEIEQFDHTFPMRSKAVEIRQKTADHLWIPSYDEIRKKNRYPFFVSFETRIKTLVGGFDASWWWLRSAYNGNYFSGVNSGGNYNINGAYSSNGVALGFCT